ncbi:MAG: flagellar basal body-associated FliL family protein [Peptococcaceae bacterium]|nr:flagellar basal body-associated FliL family protein [Peptococcaceae bacterium]
MGKNKFVIIVIALVVVLAAAGGAFFMFSSQTPAVGQQQQPVPLNQAPTLGPVYDSEEYTINLADSTKKFIRLKLAVELTNEGALAELQTKLPMFEDTLISTASSKTSDILNTLEGKEDLKNNLISAINYFLDQGQVKNIYWKEFLLS